MQTITKTKKSLNRPPWEKLRPKVTDELLSQVTKRIVDDFQPHKVILFGSYAWGRPNKDSDLDLLVIMDSDERPAPRSVPVRQTAHVDFLPMDIFVYTPAEIALRLAMRDFFIQRILDRGRTLYERGRPWENMEAHPTMTLLEEWVAKAESDYKVAVDINRRRKDPVPDATVFHCQQSAEKYLKAFLIHHSQAPDKTHRLADLLAECVRFEPTLIALTGALQVLDRFSVDPRYPGFNAGIQDAQDAMTAVRSVRKTIRKLLSL